MKRLLYVHGFNSKFDVSNPKLVALSNEYEVYGITLEYHNLSFNEIMSKLKAIVFENNVDFIVGSSIGGYLATHLAADLSLPSVIINPVIDSALTLGKYDTKYTESFRKTLNLDARSLVLLDRGDSVIPSCDTIKFLESTDFDVNVFEGGDHRFKHIDESLSLIRRYLTKIECAHN